MRFLLPSALIFAACSLYLSTAAADEKSHRKAAEDLLLVMHADQQIQAVMEHVVDLQVESNPKSAPYRDVLRKFLAKYMSWDGLKDELATTYAGVFTEQELKEAAAFYRTTTGKKILDKMPDLSSQGGQLGLKRVQEHQAELLQMLDEARSKIEKSQ